MQQQNRIIAQTPGYKYHPEYNTVLILANMQLPLTPFISVLCCCKVTDWSPKIHFAPLCLNLFPPWFWSSLWHKVVKHEEKKQDYVEHTFDQSEQSIYCDIVW